MSSTSNTCQLCHSKLAHSKNLKRHYQKVHNCNPPSTSDNSHVIKKKYNCAICEEVCPNKKQLIRHLHKTHNFWQTGKDRRKRLKCPSCDIICENYRSLDTHLLVHDHFDVVEYLEFENEFEFFKWKNKIESETKTQYCAERGLRKLKICTQREYVCHRSYMPRSRNAECKRSGKRFGTNKINAVCPSRMTVRFLSNCNKVEVHFIRKHFGHSAEIFRMRLPVHQRAEIAGKLKQGVSIQRILDDIPTSTNGENIDRIHFLKRIDVYNIIRDYKISNSTKLHELDSVRETINLMETLPELNKTQPVEDRSVETILEVLQGMAPKMPKKNRKLAYSKLEQLLYLFKRKKKCSTKCYPARTMFQKPSC